MVSARDVLPCLAEDKCGQRGDRMKWRSGCRKALAIGIALVLTGCKETYGDMSGGSSGETWMEETAESVSGPADDAGEGTSQALAEESENISQNKSEERLGEASGTVQEIGGEDPGEAGVNLTFSMGGDPAAIGLGQEVVEQIAAINEGKPPSSAVGMEELEGYYALIATHTIIGKDAETGQEATGRGKLTLYVPNLLEGLEDVSILFYDKEAEQWEVLAAEQVDTKERTVSMTLSGSGILTVIYRRQE